MAQDSTSAPMTARAGVTRLDGMIEYLLWAALAAFVIVRQFLPTTLNSRRMLLVPVGAGLFGLRALAGAPPETVFAAALLAANLLAGAGLGALRAATMRVWRRADGTWMSQGTLVTLLLWAASIGIRVPLMFVVGGGSPPGELPLFLGVTFGAQSLVVWLRMQRLADARVAAYDRAG